MFGFGNNGYILEIDVKYMAEVPIDVQSRIDGIHKKEKYRMINIDVIKKPRIRVYSILATNF